MALPVLYLSTWVFIKNNTIVFCEYLKKYESPRKAPVACTYSRTPKQMVDVPCTKPPKFMSCLGLSEKLGLIDEFAPFSHSPYGLANLRKNRRTDEGS